MKIDQEKDQVRITGVDKYGDAKCITVYWDSHQTESTFRSNVDAAIEEVMNHENR